MKSVRFPVQIPKVRLRSLGHPGGALVGEAKIGKSLNPLDPIKVNLIYSGFTMLKPLNII